MLDRLTRPLVVLLFFLSGASGLMFETLWMRFLTVTFGATHYALATLLTVFMGGLALGGFLAGRYVDRLRRAPDALILYGALELLVGLYGLVLPWLLGHVHELHAAIWLRWSPSPYAFALVRFAIVSLALLVPTTAMGATLPALSRFWARRELGLGREVGTLYSVNVFGAVTGTFLAGFVLMPALGISTTNALACSVNLSLSVAAGLLGWHLRATAVDAPVAAAPASPGVTRPLPGRRPGLTPWTLPIALGAIGVSGAVAMVYQQAWTRVLALIIGSSVYAFALILVAFLLGLAAGGAVYARRTAHQPGQVGNLATIHLVIGLSVLGSFVIMDQLPALFVLLVRATEITPARVFLLEYLVCSTVVFLPTFFMGMLFPATIAVYAEAGRGVGATVGRVYSINTVGSIVGSFLGGFVLVPFLGVQWSLAAMVAINLGLAAVFVAASGSTGRRLQALVAGCVVLALALVGAVQRGAWQRDRMTAGVFRLSVHAGGPTVSASLCPSPRDPVLRELVSGAARRHLEQARLLVGAQPEIETPCDLVAGRRMTFYEEGITATVSTRHTLVQGLTLGTCWEFVALQVNGKADASASGAFRVAPGKRCADYAGHPERIQPLVTSPRSDMETQVLSGLLGLLFRPAAHPPGRALVIGWGSGVSVGTMAHAGVKRVDAVELEPAVLRGARPFERYNRGAATHPAVRIIEADGRNVLTAQPRAYEVIVSEPSNPWMSGASSLFTREFFQLVRRRLRPDGVFVQWIQAYEISKENVRILIATLRSVFPWVMVFRPRQSEVDLLLLASPRPIPLDARALARRMRQPGIRDELERIHVRTVGDLLARAFLPPERVDALHRGSRLNTDDNVLIEFAAPKDLIAYRASSVSALFRWLHGGAAPVERRLLGAAPGLGMELVDATLRLGDLESSAQRLGGLRQQPGAAARQRLIAQLERELVDEALLRRVLAEHPLREELEAVWSSSRPPRERLAEAVRVAARFTPEVRTLRVLGLLAARGNVPAESWLLLQAAERLAPHPGDDLRWVLARISRRLALHEQALKLGLEERR